MKRKSILALILSMLLVVSSAFAFGCGNNTQNNPQTPPEETPKAEYTVFFDDIALLNGQSFNLDAKLVLEGKEVEATFTYEIAVRSINL